MMTTAIVKKWGNSQAVIIDRQVSKKMGLKEGQSVKIDIEPNVRISAFGKYKFLWPIERDRDREL
ncbi:MAG: hypothetical protein V1777_00460 [Candidatus Micrarchaeota archaeon]